MKKLRRNCEKIMKAIFTTCGKHEEDIVLNIAALPNLAVLL